MTWVSVPETRAADRNRPQEAPNRVHSGRPQGGPDTSPWRPTGIPASALTPAFLPYKFRPVVRLVRHMKAPKPGFSGHLRIQGGRWRRPGPPRARMGPCWPPNQVPHSLNSKNAACRRPRAAPRPWEWRAGERCRCGRAGGGRPRAILRDWRPADACNKAESLRKNPATSACKVSPPRATALHPPLWRATARRHCPAGPTRSLSPRPLQPQRCSLRPAARHGKGRGGRALGPGPRCRARDACPARARAWGRGGHGCVG